MPRWPPTSKTTRGRSKPSVAPPTVGLIDLGWLELCPLFRRIRLSLRYYEIHALVKRRTVEILEAYQAP